MFALNEGDAIRGDASAASKVDYTLHGIIGTTIKQLADGQLAASEGNLYTATTDGIAVTAICLVNTDSSARTANLYLKPKGGTSRRVVPKDISLAAGYCLYANGVEIKIVDTNGKEQTSAILLDDTPVDGVVTEGITSNWAYDHNAAETGVHAAGAYDLLNTGDVDDTPVDGATTAPVSSNWAYDTEAKLDDVSHSTPSRAIDGTEYQNTSGKIRLVTVNIELKITKSNSYMIGYSYVQVYVENATPPTVVITGAYLWATLNEITTNDDFINTWHSLTFIVPNNEYYKIVSTNSGDGIAPVLKYWNEWDLL